MFDLFLQSVPTGEWVAIISDLGLTGILMLAVFALWRHFTHQGSKHSEELVHQDERHSSELRDQRTEHSDQMRQLRDQYSSEMTHLRDQYARDLAEMNNKLIECEKARALVTGQNDQMAKRIEEQANRIEEQAQHITAMERRLAVLENGGTGTTTRKRRTSS